MTGIAVVARSHSIEVSKKFAVAAARFGTEEYKALQEVRRDYPGFKVVTAARKTAKPAFKGLTYEYMEKYITAHDNEEESIMDEYKMLTATCDNAEELLLEAVSYHEIKEWFFDTFPEIKDFHEKRAALLTKKAS